MNLRSEDMQMDGRATKPGIEIFSGSKRSTWSIAVSDPMDSRSLRCLSAEDLTSLHYESAKSFLRALESEDELKSFHYAESSPLFSEPNGRSRTLGSSQVPRNGRRHISVIAEESMANRLPADEEEERSSTNDQPGDTTMKEFSDSLLLGEVDFWRPAPQRLIASRSDPAFDSKSHSLSKGDFRSQLLNQCNGSDDPLQLPSLSPRDSTDPWRLPPLVHRQPPTRGPTHSLSKPRPSLSRLSSLDNLLRYRDEKAEWNRSASLLKQYRSGSREDDIVLDMEPALKTFNNAEAQHGGHKESTTLRNLAERPLSRMSLAMSKIERSKFRNCAAEVGFCFTIAMTQFLAEYLITGFAIELTKLPSTSTLSATRSGSMGAFWPASLLSLILSATLLIFARLSDMKGGYPIFLFGVAWLAIWALIPGFFSSIIMLDIARAMQGLAIAAFIPSTFAMVGSIYSEGPRKNIVLGLYSGCAPLGFFGGLFTAAALPESRSAWYFWIASGLSGITFVTAYLTVPSDRTDRRQLDLKMDWIGSVLITSGLISILYALSVEPYAHDIQSNKSGFQSPLVVGPLSSGLGLLVIAFFYEGWYAQCPLLSFDFFKPKNVKALSLAGLCFYATYGVWLYNSAELFQSPDATSASGESDSSGIKLAVWYIPTAVGGILLCVIGSSLLHIIPIMSLFLLSAIAWVGAPLLLALAPLPLSYWKFVLPSMLCATLGIDLTFTVSIVFLSSVQPLRYQGLTGAMCSILVNLAMAFGLSISEIVAKGAEGTVVLPSPEHPSYVSIVQERNIQGLKAAFTYGAASAGLGLIICVLFVQISCSSMQKGSNDEERFRSASSASTLVDDRDFGDAGKIATDTCQLRQRESDGCRIIDETAQDLINGHWTIRCG